MFVRTMYITAEPQNVGPAIDVLAKETPGMLAEQDGYQGLGVFADREVGKILAGSWWESEQAMNDSFEAMRDRRTRMLEPLVSTMAIMGMEAMAYTRPSSTTTGGFRLQRMVFEPSKADQLVDTFKSQGMPRLQEIDGFTGCSLMMDRARGVASVGVTYRDMAALEASRAPQARIRHDALTPLPWAQLIALEELEVVDLDVPTAR